MICILFIFPSGTKKQGFPIYVQEVFYLADNSYNYVSLLEDSEARKNNLTLDQPHDKVKPGIPREKESKVYSATGLFPKINKK